MRTTVRTLLAFAAIAAASTLSAQVLFTGSGYTDSSTRTRVDSTTALGVTYGTSTTDATYWLSLDGYRNSTVSNGNRDNSGYSFNISLCYNNNTDLIGVGGYKNSMFTGGTSGSTNSTYANQNYWAVSYRPDGSANYSGIRTNTSAVSSNGTRDYILIKLDYNPAALSDSLSLWFVSGTTFNTISSSHNYSTLGTADYSVTSINLSAFNAIRYYSGTEASTVSVSDVLLYQQIPEPSTYALFLGAATLGFVGYRRFRKRQA